ncbi:hypothetical protein CR513_30104, partial [Mucuna pruriens]
MELLRSLKDSSLGQSPSPTIYIELKVMKNLDCLDCDDHMKCKGLRRASIKSWEELKKKCEITYQGPRSVDEYFKEMEVTLIRAQFVES